MSCLWALIEAWLSLFPRKFQSTSSLPSIHLSEKYSHCERKGEKAAKKLNSWESWMRNNYQAWRIFYSKNLADDGLKPVQIEREFQPFPSLNYHRLMKLRIGCQFKKPRILRTIKSKWLKFLPSISDWTEFWSIKDLNGRFLESNHNSVLYG